MKNASGQSSRTAADLALLERRTIRAPAERLFAAWTEPALLRAWWGPYGVDCTEAEVDLRVGGGYRLGNRLPDGSLVWITGEFLAVEPPRRLVYTWRVSNQPGQHASRVTVRFEPVAEGTEVVVRHEQFAAREPRDHARIGWGECLLGLADWVAATGA